MRDLSFDPDVDAAYVTLPVDLPDGIGGELFLDFDEDGHLLGVEILGASALLRPEILRGP